MSDARTGGKPASPPKEYPILKGSLGSPSILQYIFLIFGFFCIPLQIMILTGGMVDESGTARFFPTMVGSVMLLSYTISARRKGHYLLYRTQLKGTKKNGRDFKIMLDQIGKVDLSVKGIRILDQEGETLLWESAPWPAALPGTTWLLLKYSATLPKNLWQLFKPEEAAETQDDEKVCKRIFVNDEAAPLFQDAGRTVFFQERAWYFPLGNTAPVMPPTHPDPATRKNSIQQALKGPAPRQKFEPDPGKIPMIPLVRAVIRTPELSQDEKLDWLDKLAVAHGGTILETPDTKTGETSGIRVQIECHGS